MRRAALGLAVAWSVGSAGLVPARAAEGAAPASPARAAVDDAIKQVLAILREQGATADEKRDRIEQIAYDRFDFKTISSLVLGPGRKKFSDVQQQDFAELFRTYLSHQYGDRVERYRQEDIVVLGERDEPRGDVTVFTKVIGGEYDGATIDYRMRPTDGTWRVIDVIIEGVSLVANYRDQFKDVINRDGPDGLMVQLREKNAAGTVDTVGAPKPPVRGPAQTQPRTSGGATATGG